jgi:hypothetical protein
LRAEGFSCSLDSKLHFLVKTRNTNFSCIFFNFSSSDGFNESGSITLQIRGKGDGRKGLEEREVRETEW